MPTAQDIVKEALRKIGVVAIDEDMTADQGADGLRALQRFLSSLQNREVEFYRDATINITLTTALSYAVSGVPKAVRNARVVRGAIETPMTEMTRQEYDDLPVKTSTGFPTTFYYDRDRLAGTIYIWPPLAAANGEILRLTVETKVTTPAALSDTVDIPEEWEDAVVYGLADRLADDYGVDNPKVTARAERELNLALARDREGSVFFGEY